MRMKTSTRTMTEPERALVERAIGAWFTVFPSQSVASSLLFAMVVASLTSVIITAPLIVYGSPLVRRAGSFAILVIFPTVFAVTVFQARRKNAAEIQRRTGIRNMVDQDLRHGTVVVTQYHANAVYRFATDVDVGGDVYCYKLSDSVAIVVPSTFFCDGGSEEVTPETFIPTGEFEVVRLPLSGWLVSTRMDGPAITVAGEIRIPRLHSDFSPLKAFPFDWTDREGRPDAGH